MIRALAAVAVSGTLASCVIATMCSVGTAMYVVRWVTR